MEATQNTETIYSIYKKTFISMVIAMIFMIAGAYLYVYYRHPVRNISAGGVTEVTHGGISYSSYGAYGGQADAGAQNAESFALFLNGASADSDYLWIPVSEGVSSSDITIENHYMDRQLWVSVAGGDPSYYKEAYISGNLEGVSYAEAVPEEDRLTLRFSMDQVYEYSTIFEDGVLYIGKMKPREVYDRIVIIDPAGFVPKELTVENSLSPERICLDISTKLLNALENENIRVYVTSLDERVASDEDSIALMKDVRPDMYIRIETSYDADSKVYGTETVYNGTYFIPGFGSVELADLLEANVTTSIGGKAMGLTESGETDTVIKKATVPAAAIKVGYYTNTQENILLNRDDYRTRISEGIVNAVMAAYGDDEE